MGVNLRYINRIIRAQQFRSFPKTIERRSYGARHHLFEHFFDKISIKIRKTWRLAEVFQTPCDVKHPYRDLNGFLYCVQMFKEAMGVQKIYIWIDTSLYDQLMGGKHFWGCGEIGCGWFGPKNFYVGMESHTFQSNGERRYC